MTASPIKTHLGDLAPGYDAILSDVWGVVHNGLKATPEACEALAAFRRKGGQVVLITNAPRPREEVAKQIEQFGVPRDTYDAIASSGDVWSTRMRTIMRSHLYQLSSTPNAGAAHTGPSSGTRRTSPRRSPSA